MPNLKRKSKIILILFFLAQFTIIIPNVIAVLQINILNFNTDKNEYFTDEDIIIEASWILNYNPIEEWAYVQIQLYNNLDQLLWCSEQNDSMGIINKTWNVNILDLNFSFSENPINFSVIFYLFHMVGEEIFSSGPIATKSIQISKKLISCSLFNYKERINYGEPIDFQALFYNITDTITYYPDNLSITLELYKANESVFSQNYNTVNGWINVNISTTTFLIVGKIELRLIASENSFYFGNVFNYDLEVEQLNLFCSLYNYIEKINYGEPIDFQALFYNITDTITYYPDNLSITLELYKANESVFSQNYNTVNGWINVNISTTTFLIVGEIELRLIASENSFYFGNVFNYDLEVGQLDLFCSLYNYIEKINYGEPIDFQALFYNITDTITYYPDNLSITLELYKANESVFSQNYNTVNGWINVNISTTTFLIVGEIELRLIASENSFYFDNIFSYSLKVQKLGLNYYINEYDKNIKYQEDIPIIIRFFNRSNGQIRYLEIFNISMKIFSNNIMIYNNFYNSDKNGTLIIVIPSEIFEENGEISININIFNNSYYKDLSIKLILNDQNENNLIFNLNNLILILVVSIFSGAGTFFIFLRKRKINKNLFEITFKH